MIFRAVNDGQVHLKLLIPSIAAGAVIGKGGETISHMQKEYDAAIKMSKSQDFYPGLFFCTHELKAHAST